MGASSDARTMVLHGLRLRGLGDVLSLAEVTGLDADVVAVELASLADAGLAAHRSGRLAGWGLTPAGRIEHGRALTTELDHHGLRGDVEDCYERFLVHNPVLLDVCTRWQLRDDAGEPVPNDHTDPEHDAAVVSELTRLHDSVGPVLDDLAGLLRRFARYRGALGAALAAVRAGDVDRFTKPVADSYHTIWFELHEDLLATLGLERSAEVPAGGRA